MYEGLFSFLAQMKELIAERKTKRSHWGSGNEVRFHGSPEHETFWEEGWNWHLFSWQNISPKPKIQKRGDFGAFQSPKLKPGWGVPNLPPKNNNNNNNNNFKKSPELYIWFSLHSRKYRRMIKKNYFIYGL